MAVSENLILFKTKGCVFQMSSFCEYSNATELMQQVGPSWNPRETKPNLSPTLVEVVRMSKDEVDALIRQLQGMK
jgi:hypothetical protein